MNNIERHVGLFAAYEVGANIRVHGSTAGEKPSEVTSDNGLSLLPTTWPYFKFSA
jgi:hypothetical protein